MKPDQSLICDLTNFVSTHTLEDKYRDQYRAMCGLKKKDSRLPNQVEKNWFFFSSRFLGSFRVNKVAVEIFNKDAPVFDPLLLHIERFRFVNTSCDGFKISTKEGKNGNGHKKRIHFVFKTSKITCTR